MAYIWSYLRRYPKWLAMNFTAAILFVIANLGLPTVLARMIDEGINRGDVDKLYAYAWVMFGVVLTGIVGRILLSYAVGKLTTTMVQVMRTDMWLSSKNSTQMAHSLSPKPITMAIQTIPSVNYLEWIVT